MSIVEPIIRDNHILPPDDDDWDSVFHIEWESDANFFTGADLRPRTPLCKATADRQITLARAAALIIRTALRNIPVDIPDFDPSRLLGFRKQLYQWMSAYNSSPASKLALGDVTMTAMLDIFSSLTQMGIEGEILAKIGPNIGDILQGIVDPMALLCEDGRIHRMQDGMELAQKTRAHLRAYLSSYASKKPVMNVLEVGASTSNNTDAIFGVFDQRNVSYTITDSSLPVLEQAKFPSTNDRLKFKAFDVNRDPVDQGVSPGSFDVVLINNILYTANSLEETLANLRKLLLPGGVIALVGFSDLSPVYNLIFGMNENMWPDERFEQLPYPASSEWNKMLRSNGFSGLEPATKTFEYIGQSSYCIISTAVASTQNLMVNVLPDVQGKFMNFADQLSTSLADTGTPSTISPTLDGVSSRFIYIVLDNGSSPLTSYEELTKANNVLWISMKTDGMEQRDVHVVTRFAKGARRSNAGLRLVTLDVKQGCMEYSDILKVITRIIQVSFQEDRGTRTEAEYEYRNGKVLVPRVKSAGMTNKLG
ncbi:S-adenosyl-L-methionine-dependent methyltransferase [Fusarium tricinctum]|uniref:S-adenosyl-L-methionine-dependent methyltransferase n=1 Tax=Fusarium tricinctum TaxID=61284 RepID=A0A8K0W770_9HYPO|nr:S-adenosyl-L-methionine-dependent methyltransferase [Fusarium tricinctum]